MRLTAFLMMAIIPLLIGIYAGDWIPLLALVAGAILGTIFRKIKRGY